MDFETELERLIDLAVDEGVTRDEIIGELEMTAQRLREEEDDALAEGRAAYEADVQRTPTYHTGEQRPSWDEIGETARQSWQRKAVAGE
jgi:hypothetical protein